MEILFENRPILCAVKVTGLPLQSNTSDAPDILTLLSKDKKGIFGCISSCCLPSETFILWYERQKTFFGKQVA